MSKRGKRGRSKRPPARPTPSASPASVAPLPALEVAPAPEAAPAPAPAPASAPAPVEASTGMASDPEPAEPELTPGPVSTELAEPSVPPAGDLDARFFAESSSEAWLAHELELRDPRFVRKMTANVARRRAHLARYVVGVVGVAVALCLAALVKSAVPVGDDDSHAHPAAQMAMPAERAEPVAQPVVAPTATAAANATGAPAEPTDGGGG